MFLKNVIAGMIALSSTVLVNAQGINIQKVGHQNAFMPKQKPFLIFGGETGNSSASTIYEMNRLWPITQKMHLNTILAPAYWNQIEPNEGKFDFSNLDSLISKAQAHKQHLVLLWFGAWKNSMSSYVPDWIKKDAARFPRVRDNADRSMEILSVFGKNTYQADESAFVKLLSHLKAKDPSQVVLMIQVENEIGMLSTAREHSAIADQAFASNVPTQLMSYLEAHRDSLAPELSSRWAKQGNKLQGDWSTLFGNGLSTDEYFQAWYYADYVNRLVTVGKKVYDIPMYVNAALPRTGKLPGEYPSAGPIPNVIDIWKAGAPHLNMLSPDFYNPDTKYWCDLYARADNPLFVPEMQLDATCAAKVFYIIGHYHALGFSPFSIENASPDVAEKLGNSYALLTQLQPFLFSDKVKAVDGFIVDHQAPITHIEMGKYRFRISHDFTLGWSPESKNADWPMSGGLIIQLDEDEFLIAGTGLVVTAENIDTHFVTNQLSVDNVQFENGSEEILSHFNGDETHQGRHVRIPVGHWQIQHVKYYNSPALVK